MLQLIDGGIFLDVDVNLGHMDLTHRPVVAHEARSGCNNPQVVPDLEKL